MRPLNRTIFTPAHLFKAFLSILLGLTSLLPVTAHAVPCAGSPDPCPWATVTNFPAQGAPSPRGVAMDAAGNLYVASFFKVKKFDAAGAYVMSFGTNGTADGQFTNPAGVAVDGSGNVYVVDAGSAAAGTRRVQKFNGTTGAFISKFGTNGTGNGQFNNPIGIAIDSLGNIYVADTLNQRVQKFTSAGVFTSIIGTGTAGAADGQFNNPEYIAFDASDNLYVSDFSNNRVQKFNSVTGAYISKFGSLGTGDGQFTNGPHGIAISAAGDIYVSDYGNNRVQKFNSAGVFQAKWGGLPVGAADGQFNLVYDVVTDASNNVYVADNANGRVQKFTSAGVFVSKIGVLNNEVATPERTVIDTSGNRYVVDRDFNRIMKFDSGGNFLIKFGTLGSGNGQFNTPTDIALDSTGNVYVLDGLNSRIVKFTSAGAFVSIISGVGTADGLLELPFGIGIDSADNIYVADTFNSRVQKFNSAGTFVTKVGSAGAAAGQFNFPIGIGIDAADNVYVADLLNSRVQKFTSALVFSSSFGTAGAGNGQFSSPYDVAFDATGNIYVADAGNNRVQKFTSGGVFISKWGAKGGGEGEMNSPLGVTLDPAGNILVTDSGNDRVSLFVPTDTVPNAFAFNDLTGVGVNAVTSSNRIFVTGINVPTPISIVGGQYEIDNDNWTSAAGTIDVGSSFKVRHTSAGTPSTATNTTLTIGGVSDTFTSTTAGADTTPDAFSFGDLTDVAFSKLQVSNAIKVNGITVAASISVSGGEYLVTGGSWTTAAGTVNPGQTVKVRHTSANTPSTAVNTTLTIGGVVSDTFTSTTKSTTDTTPDAFTFTDQTGVPVNKLIVSNAIVVRGIEAAVPISISGGQYLITGGSWTTAAGTVNPNAVVKVRHTSAGTPGTDTNTTLNIGGVSDTFTTTTLE